MNPADTHGEAAGPERTRILIFEVGSRRFGLVLAVVREVFELVDPPVPVPGAPPWVGGVINHHGEVVPYIRMDTFLEVPGGTNSRVVLADLEPGVFALGVDQVASLESVHVEGPGYQGRRRAWYRGTLLELLDPESLAGELMQRASRVVDAGGRA